MKICMEFRFKHAILLQVAAVIQYDMILEFENIMLKVNVASVIPSC